MTTTRLARLATLDGFVDAVASAPGISLGDIEPLTTLLVRTRNSDYRITVGEGANVVVQGGRYFSEQTAASFDGASAGGSLLKVGWIGLGLRMEFRVGSQRIVTSPVAAIATERTGGRHVH